MMLPIGPVVIFGASNFPHRNFLTRGRYGFSFCRQMPGDRQSPLPTCKVAARTVLSCKDCLFSWEGHAHGFSRGHSMLTKNDRVLFIPPHFFSPFLICAHLRNLPTGNNLRRPPFSRLRFSFFSFLARSISSNPRLR